ncbi:hypothetical protein EPN29_10110 [bacterium]|nr:MAG: hypothetical protein EPN29_10110 [bacterium]
MFSGSMLLGPVVPITEGLQLATAAINCVAAALLISAGVSKLARPDPFRHALEEVVGRTGRLVSRTWIRLIAVFEIVAGVSLTTAPSRVPGAVAAGCLGICFVVLGVAGSIRGSRLPCGCFGATNGRRPFGWVNVVSGAFFILLLLTNLLQSVVVQTVPSLYLVSIAIVGWTFWVHRGLVGGVLVRRA